MEEGLVPVTVVFALGAAALGGPDALRALLTLAGQSPAVDIATCLLLIGMLTAQLLSVALLARFVRKPPRAQAQAGGARAGAAPRRPRVPAADCLARMTLAISVGVAFTVAACLVAVSGFGGLMSSVRLAFDFAWKSPAGVLLLLCFTPLLRVLRDAHGAALAAGTRRRTFCLAAVPLVGICLLVAPFAGAIDTFIGGVAAFAVLGTVLLTRFSRNGAGAETARVARLTAQVTSLVAVCFALAYFFLLVGVPGGESGGGKHAACSV